MTTLYAATSLTCGRRRPFKWMHLGRGPWPRPDLCDATHSTIEGRVTRKAAAINPGSCTLRVEVNIPNSNHALVPGLYVQVRFDLETRSLVQPPAAALIFRSKGPQVAVFDSNDIVHCRPITIARDDGDVVEIESGFSPAIAWLKYQRCGDRGREGDRGRCDTKKRGSFRFTACVRRARSQRCESSGSAYPLSIPSDLTWRAEN